VYPSADAAIELVKSAGLISPWSEYWERLYRYEFEEVEGGVRVRTFQPAILEDAGYGKGMCSLGDDASVYRLWRHLTMPVLLVRATQDILPGFGSICNEQERDRFLREVPTARVVEVDSTHFLIAMREECATVIDAFLREPR